MLSLRQNSLQRAFAENEIELLITVNTDDLPVLRILLMIGKG